MKLMYTRPQDGGVNIVIAADKLAIEKVLGELTQEAYEAHILEKSIPEEAINVKLITDDDLPNNREFRNAWVDKTQDTKVNIDLEKAKELKLAELRSLRDEELVKLDQIFMIAFEKGEDLTEIKERKSFLRDATEPLKSLKVEGVDDEAVLNQIRELATLEV